MKSTYKSGLWKMGIGFFIWFSPVLVSILPGSSDEGGAIIAGYGVFLFSIPAIILIIAGFIDLGKK